MNNNQWVISDVSRQTGLEPHVLRYWEKELELDIPRNQLGHRYYLDCHIETFKKVHKLKESGYQLKAIKRVIKKNGTRESIDNNCEVKTEALVDTVDTADKVNSKQKMAGADQSMIDQNVAASAEPVQDQISAENQDVSAKKVGSEVNTASTKPVSASGTASASNASNASNIISMPKISIVTDETINKMQQSEKSESNDKIEQFKRILGDIILDTMDKHSEELERRISDRIIKQMDYLLRVQEEMEEERFKQLDETIRAYQRDRKEGRRQHHFIMKRFHTPTQELLIK